MIHIETQPADNPLTGQSKWWGEPDMPVGFDWPAVRVVDEEGERYDDPLTFVCQIRCEDISPMDSDGLLPHEGMLYFFAALDYFLGDIETPAYQGMGEWRQDYFRVLYSPTCDNLHTHHVNYPDGTPATMPAEAVTFSKGDASDDGLKLLGNPYIEEVAQDMPGMLSLLQLDGNDRWNLVFYDCGTLNFLIRPDDLRKRRWNRTKCYLFSY